MPEAEFPAAGSRTAAAQQSDVFSAERALEFLLREWDELWTRQSSLEQRGITLITTSGVLVTLTFGFAAAVTKGKNFGTFSHSEKLVLCVALGLFAFSAGLALWVNVPTSWDVPDFSGFLGYTLPEVPRKQRPLLIRLIWGSRVPSSSSYSGRSPEAASLTSLQRLASAIDGNSERLDQMALQLASAFLVQILAIIALAVDVGFVVG